MTPEKKGAGFLIDIKTQSDGIKFATALAHQNSSRMKNLTLLLALLIALGCRTETKAPPVIDYQAIRDSIAQEMEDQQAKDDEAEGRQNRRLTEMNRELQVLEGQIEVERMKMQKLKRSWKIDKEELVRQKAIEIGEMERRAENLKAEIRALNGGKNHTSPSVEF